MGLYDDDEMFNEAVKHREKPGDKARDRLRDADVLDSIDFNTTTGKGTPIRTIVNYATETVIDHIVIGSHGRPGVVRVPLGSVTEVVVRRAPVLVTVVR